MAEQARQPAADTEPDVVTQLQTCLDQLATQLYASLRYVTTRHPLSAPIEPLELPPTQISATTTSTTATASSTPNGNTSFPSTATPASAYLSQTSPTSQPRPAPLSQSQSESQAQPQSQPQPSPSAAAYLQRYPRFTDPLQNPNDPDDTGEDAQNKIEPISPTHQPLAIPDFQAAVRELAQDLVAKQKQIEGLIGALPENIGEGAEYERQERRLQELDKELEGLQGEVEQAQVKKDKMLERVDGVVSCWANGAV